MADILPHQNPVSGPLSFRHMYNAEYRPGEDESINYRVQRRKRMESFDPNTCSKCGDECECGPDCNCGSECTCCGSVSEDVSLDQKIDINNILLKSFDKKERELINMHFKYDMGPTAIARELKMSPSMVRDRLGKVMSKLKRLAPSKKKAMRGENTLMRFKTFIG